LKVKVRGGAEMGTKVVGAVGFYAAFYGFFTAAVAALV